MWLTRFERGGCPRMSSISPSQGRPVRRLGARPCDEKAEVLE